MIYGTNGKQGFGRLLFQIVARVNPKRGEFQDQNRFESLFYCEQSTTYFTIRGQPNSSFSSSRTENLLILEQEEALIIILNLGFCSCKPTTPAVWRHLFSLASSIRTFQAGIRLNGNLRNFRFFESPLLEMLHPLQDSLCFPEYANSSLLLTSTSCS